MPARKCARCGKTPPEGFASISIGKDQRWYCHGDGDNLTCYEQASMTVPFDPKEN